MVILAIAGPHGSGKSLIAKNIAEEFKLAYVSAGNVFREVAKNRNITLEQLSYESANNTALDIEIDNRTKELSKQDNTVVDAQLAAYFTSSNIDLKICITASPEVRWKRIAKRDGIYLEAAQQQTLVREDTEYQRFRSLYGIDVNDLSVYDIVINTDRLSKKNSYTLVATIVNSIITQKINFK